MLLFAGRVECSLGPQEMAPLNHQAGIVSDGGDELMRPKLGRGGVGGHLFKWFKWGRWWGLAFLFFFSFFLTWIEAGDKQKNLGHFN